MWRDLAIHQRPEQPDRAVNTIAYWLLGPKAEAAFDAINHGFGDGNLAARLARVPSASTMIPALLSMRQFVS
jgi:hypothetical protein